VEAQEKRFKLLQLCATEQFTRFRVVEKVDITLLISPLLPDTCDS
jgi:hypothetical protein